MCPALIFAANRNARVRGRTVILVVSIRMRNGFNQVGAPSGNRWATVALGLCVVLDIIIDSHIGRPRRSVKIKCLDREIEYGLRPARLMITIIIKKVETIVVIPLIWVEDVRDNCW